MSFKDADQIALALDLDMAGLFAEDVRFILNGATDNPVGEAEVLLGDARSPELSIDQPVNLVVTSPPYANRMSYIRELRPYMYWLGFLVNGRDAGEMDWEAIGGTWGVATSRLTDWKPSSEEFSLDVLRDAIERIAHGDNKNGKLLSNYVAKYFDDMWAHFRGLRTILADDARLHYIVGNSTFYGVLLPVEEIYMAMLKELGFAKVECRAIRKRNSKKELIEFDVTARWRA
ncbi:hypothetical protein [Bradyrhizobium viridifuturi]|uniref:hypothetical protein n=1 Tax=Bradyrhizobium viridifuturi TaxID=1654716 RepID=UPI001FCD3C41|nr:hypothetical protein [Bradyrhizobium viridifuturi]